MSDSLIAASDTSSDAVSTPVMASANVVPPEVESLRAMFPAMDVSDLTAVLTSHNGLLEEAADTLLAMNDPSYRQHDLERLQVDAELARQLEAHEGRLLQPRVRRQSVASPGESGSKERHGPAALPYTAYVPRQGARQSLDRTQRAEVDRNGDDVDQLTEQLYVGKKTFGKFLGKAKGLADVVNERIKASASPSLAAEDSSPRPPPKELPLSPVTSNSTPKTSDLYDDKHRPTINVPERLPRPHQEPEELSSVHTHNSPSSSPSGLGEGPAAPVAVTPDPPKKAPDLSQIEHLLLPRKSVKLEQAHQKEDENDDELEYVKSPFDDD
ncbi:BQ2448_2321 [Microbotryum intermedium]|uniref:BQ2448_2321 protein n=1 Tax=Microbotryum intermedium TaxID=269621 RepID=A0A238FB40_9BASI|nr:BQ2448_2321 [Microbotryum intermedium]